MTDEALAHQFAGEFVMFQLESRRYLGVGVDQRLRFIGETYKQAAVSSIEYGDTEQFDPLAANSSVI